MKKQIFSAMVTGCLLALLIAVPAKAQLPGTEIRVRIPFDFIVNGRTLPAGNYEISRITDTPEGLLIRNTNEKRDHAMFQTEPDEARSIPDRSEIVFQHYGNSYFLTKVWTAGEETGQELIQSRSERRLIREMASNGTEAETVALAGY